MRRAVQLAVALAALFIGGIATRQDAGAFDYRYLYNDPFFNPDGGGECCGDRLKGIEGPWVLQEVMTAYQVCADPDWTPLPQYIVAAISDWASVLPGSLATACGPGPKIYLHHTKWSGPYPCGGLTACVQFELPPEDGQRGARYPNDGTTIWIDDFNHPMTDDGYRAVMAHELGHIYGLNENYLHDANHTPASIQCNNNDPQPSIMDAVLVDGLGRIYTGCDNVLGPTARDVAYVQDLYDLSPTYVPLIDAKGADIIATVLDLSAAESHIAVLVEWFNGIGGSFYDSRALRHDVGGWNHFVTFAYRLPSNASEGFYQLCVYAYNALYTGLDSCSSWVYVIPNEPLRDTDGDGYSDRDEAGWPMCYGGANDDAPDDGDINDGCPAYGGVKETGFECDNTYDDDGEDGPVAMVNDGCPANGVYSEAGFRIGTGHRSRCSPGAESGPSPGWPSDFVSGSVPNTTDKLTIQDLTSFIAPVRRLYSNPGFPNFDVRWDLVPGRGIFANFISINDVTALVAGPSGFPPMFSGAKAFGGPVCTGS